MKYWPINQSTNYAIWPQYNLSAIFEEIKKAFSFCIFNRLSSLEAAVNRCFTYQSNVSASCLFLHYSGL